MIDPWIVGGDLNMIARMNEKKGGIKPNMHKVTQFHDLTVKTKIFNIKFIGFNFTWKHGKTLERLDHYLFMSKWFQTFNNTKLNHMARLASKHYPLLILIYIIEKLASSSFRFHNLWIFCRIIGITLGLILHG